MTISFTYQYQNIPLYKKTDILLCLENMSKYRLIDNMNVLSVSEYRKQQKGNTVDNQRNEDVCPCVFAALASILCWSCCGDTAQPLEKSLSAGGKGSGEVITLTPQRDESAHSKLELLIGQKR